MNKFYLVTDDELKTGGIQSETRNYEVYGNVELSREEIECLSLGPKYMTMPELDREDFEVEVEVECVKSRIEINNRKEVEEGGKVDDEELEMMREIEKKGREIYDKDSGELSMSKLRVTDAKYNTRSFLPREVDTEDEVLLQARRQEVMADFDEYAQMTNKEKWLDNKNLTMEQIEGRKSLIKRWKEGEIVITLTDKSGKFAVVETLNMFKSMIFSSKTQS